CKACVTAITTETRNAWSGMGTTGPLAAMVYQPTQIIRFTGDDLHGPAARNGPPPPGSSQPPPPPAGHPGAADTRAENRALMVHTFSTGGFGVSKVHLERASALPEGTIPVAVRAAAEGGREVVGGVVSGAGSGAEITLAAIPPFISRPSVQTRMAVGQLAV